MKELNILEKELALGTRQTVLVGEVEFLYENNQQYIVRRTIQQPQISEEDIPSSSTESQFQESNFPGSSNELDQNYFHFD